MGRGRGRVKERLAPARLWWLLPVLRGLLLSVPLSLVLSSIPLGRWLREARPSQARLEHLALCGGPGHTSLAERRADARH